MTASSSPARLSDVLGALSVATDLAAGLPMETSLRTCVVATLVARAHGLTAAEVSDTYRAALLRHLGCTAYAHEAAEIAAGDDHDLIRTFEGVDRRRRAKVAARAISRLAAGAPAGARIRAVGRALARPSLGDELAAAQCDQAVALASDLGMSAGVVRALGEIFERFDGRGVPRGLDGRRLGRVTRVLHVANVVEIQHRHGGRDHALREVRRRRGAHLEPGACEAFLSCSDAVWEVLEATSTWERYLDAEPGPIATVDGDQLDRVALAFARYADLKSPWMLGHSPAVAGRAVDAAAAGGLSSDDVALARRSGLLHDLGVVSVPNGVWEKPGPLTPVEWERVRLHAYYTERILGRIPSLAPCATISGGHHERCDGSGYPRGIADPNAARLSALLACADTYEALVSARPHRPAFTPQAAARMLADEAARGRLTSWSVECVLAAAGHARAPRASSPLGLTAREEEVLVLLARGLTNKEMASALGIAARTVQHHVEHIYAKVGVNTRAAAALVAVRHDLTRPR